MTDTPSISLAPGRFFGLVPCAGKGLRAMGAQAADDTPKQYRELAGQPMVMHALAAFAGVSRLTECLVVVAPGDSFLNGHAGSRCRVADCGGDSRAASVRNGLRELQRLGARAQDWVLVHDAARCLITAALIDRLIDACRNDAVGGLLAQPLADTLKSAQDARVQATLPRADKWLAQTPQMFRLGLLLQALEHAGEQVTDESSALEALGHQPLLVKGDARNFKVTFPEDFLLAEALLRGRNDS
ncbi:MAG: 2-C-methyl-D-erythritol 4-phosphate cytidylyltransferase [Burkholderiaceae bacterium]|nr:2-C-methyl-D-erythritol 4-phosphate cytidylyltransferase [Burkholderiaceae bacterium]